MVEPGITRDSDKPLDATVFDQLAVLNPADAQATLEALASVFYPAVPADPARKQVAAKRELEDQALHEFPQVEAI